MFSFNDKKLGYILVSFLVLFSVIRGLYWDSSWQVSILFTLIVLTGVLGFYNLHGFITGEPMYIYDKYEKGQWIQRGLALFLSLLMVSLSSFIVYRAFAVYVGAIPAGGQHNQAVKQTR